MYNRTDEFIISSPSNIPGTFQSPTLSINPMFGNHPDKKFFVISLENPGDNDIIFGGKWPIQRWFQTYARKAQRLCILFSVFFWKRIEYHWMLKGMNWYTLPDFWNEIVTYKWMRINSAEERENKYITQNWTEIEPIVKLLETNPDAERFLRAWALYWKALTTIEYDEEIAYLELIRCIELLSDDEKVEEDEDQFTWELAQIYQSIKQDHKLALFFRYYHGSTKKFCNTILKRTKDDPVRTTTESKWTDFSLPCLNEVNRNKALRNTYTIRSNYVHAGLHFWDYIMPNEDWLHELIQMQPGMPDEINKCIRIKEWFTFSWLERIVRCCLINFLTNTSFKIS